jgi:hypothetical protein
MISPLSIHTVCIEKPSQISGIVLRLGFKYASSSGVVPQFKVKNKV